MTQKWNLQDIRPAQPRKRPTTEAPKRRPMEEKPASRPPEEREHIPNIIIEDGTKKKKRPICTIYCSVFCDYRCSCWN